MSRSTSSASAPLERSAPGATFLAATWVWLLVWTLLRAACAFLPSMWPWGADALRFSPAAAGWIVWGISALALIPPVSRMLVPSLESIGSTIKRQPGAAATGFGLAAVILVAMLPDRTWLVGDFLWRQIAVQGNASFDQLYPQALPLDRWLHDVLPRLLVHRAGLEANDASRIVGALAAALWGFAGVDVTRELELRGVAAGACALAVVGGGALLLMTGLAKSYAELAPLSLLVAAAALHVARTGSSFVRLGLWLALALLAHRSAVALVPGAGLAAALGWRAAAARGPAGVRDRAIGIALPLLALAAGIPPILRAASTIDRAHFALGGATDWWSPRRLVDVANALLLTAPLAPLALVLAPGARAASPRAAGVLVALTLPLVLATLLIHPAHGAFRDTDVFAPAGVMLELVAAWALGILVQEPRRAWLGVAAALCVLSTTLGWLVHFSDADRGIARVEAFLAEPPARDETARAGAWDYLGFRTLDLGRVDEAASAFERSAELAPTPRVLRQWANVELRRGDWNAVTAIWSRLLARDPGNLEAWSEWAALAARNGDAAHARTAADTLLRLNPGNGLGLRIRQAFPEMPSPSPANARP